MSRRYLRSNGSKHESKFFTCGKGLYGEEILSDRISPSAYNTFLREMLANFSSIYKDLSVHCNGTLVREEELDDIRACINKTGVFDQVDGIHDALEGCKKIVNGMSDEV